MKREAYNERVHAAGSVVLWPVIWSKFGEFDLGSTVVI
jgi:hypothetical protein